MKKDIIFIQNVMAGGGAERHMINIVNYIVSEGWNVRIILTDMHRDEVVTLFDLDSRVTVVCAKDYLLKTRKKCNQFFLGKFLLRYINYFVNQIGYSERKPKWLLKHNYTTENKEIIKYINSIIKKSTENTVLLTVLDGPTFQTIFANKNKKCHHIIAEFADPARKIKSSQLVKMMFEDYYPLADHVVFQSPGARDAFNEIVQRKGIIIPNPLSDNLPEPYKGIRKKEIVNFCRFSSQKNIPLLLSAFKLFYEIHSDYTLIIYGGAVTNEEKKCYQQCVEVVQELNLESVIRFPGFCDNIHEKIIDAAMFVSSSDYEGLSNSMIEAMAIGLPTICTDCPAGGASYIIENGINGLLTPVGDERKLFEAMRRVAEDNEFAESLSLNAVKVRDRLKLEKIANEWMEVLND